MSDKRSSIALEWVSREIEETLGQAADALGGFINNIEDVTKLRFCLTYIHQVSGSLKMIELHGAALLTEEIEKVLLAIQQEDIAGSKSVTSSNVILNSIKNLISYINFVNDSGEDSPKKLLPELNQIRALLVSQDEIDNEVGFSEADLFNPDINYARSFKHHPINMNAEEFNDLIRKLRQNFQKSLVGIVKDHDLANNYQLLKKVLSALYKTCKGTSSEPLWQIAFAIAEQKEIEQVSATIEDKKVLMLLDKQLKYLEENSLSALSEVVESSVLKTLLYSIATASTSTLLIDELRSTYVLEEALSLEPEEEVNADLNDQVTREVVNNSREKLEEIKELFVECVASQWNQSIVRPVPNLLKEVEDNLTDTSLAILLPYLSAAKDFIKKQLATLQPSPEWQTIESFADVISSLDFYLECAHAEGEKKLSAILQGANASLKTLGYNANDHKAADLQILNVAAAETEDEVDDEILEIFIEEATEVIESINGYLPHLIADANDQNALTEVRRAYHTLKGSGRMVQAYVVGDFAWSIERMLNRVLDGEAKITENCLIVLQEATAYIPTILSAFEKKSVVDKVHVDALVQKADLEWQGTIAEKNNMLEEKELRQEPDIKMDEIEELQSSLQIDTIDPLGVNATSDKVEQIISPESNSIESEEEDIDDEILEIFTEEAEEVLASINEFLPQLHSDNSNQDVLAELRRAFHTLKGSGRMVKAFTMGDFAWSVEQMLNKIMDGNAQVTANCLQILNDATAHIPTMMEAFSNKEMVDRVIVNEIIARAEQELKAEVPETELAATETSDVEKISAGSINSASEDTVDAESLLIDEKSDIDEDILEIFIEEAAEVLEDIQKSLPVLQENRSDMDALTQLQRSYHTLKGSGLMVQALIVGDFASSLERMLDKIIDGHAKVTENCMTLFVEAAAAIPSIISAFADKQQLDTTVINKIISKADAEWKGELALVDSLMAGNPEEALLDDSELEAALIDDELIAIFTAEAEGHIKVFFDFLDTIDPGFEDVEVSLELQRSFHTLKGSAFMADVLPMAELVAPLETFVKDLLNYQIKADAEILAIFMQAADILQNQLKELKKGRLQHSEASQQFITDIKVLHDKRIEITDATEDNETGISDTYSLLLSEALSCLTEAAELCQKWRQSSAQQSDKLALVACMQKLSDTATTAKYEEVAHLSLALAAFYQLAAEFDNILDPSFFTLSDKANDELDDMFDFIAAHQAIEEAVDIIDELKRWQPEVAVSELAEAELEFIEPDEPELSPHTTDDISSEQLNDPALNIALYQQQLEAADAETMEIFIEEAVELMDGLDENIHAWVDENENLTFLAEIKRSLHTLKGGARLAELSVLGDLTHDYESLIEKTELQGIYSAEFFQSVEVYQQQLQAFIDYACNGKLSTLESIASLMPAPAAEVLNATTGETDDEANHSEIDLSALLEECHKADVDTLEIFVEELSELSVALENSANAWMADHAKVQEADELKRVLHTLKGGARMTELPSLGDLTHQFESQIEAAEADQNFDNSFFVKLQSYLEQTQKMMDCVLHLDAADKTEVESDILSIEPLISAVPAENEIVMPVAELVPEVSESDDSEDIDEVLELFLEEAKEQTEGLEECLAQLVKDGAKTPVLDEIKRLLHTLKGGARMASQTRIGDLSHDFETFIINAERDGALDHENFIDEVQTFHEKQNQAVDALQKSMHKSLESDDNNVVPIRPDVNVEDAAANVSQAAIDATKNFIESFNQKQQQKRVAQEPVKVAPDLLDNLINLAGESSIGRSRIEEQVSDLSYSVDEMDVTVDRLHGQLRRLEIETEAQIVFRQEQVESEGIENFDPLEMDRYSQMQQLSKSLIESASDLDDISATFTNKMRDMETLLVQQGRINSELQEGLMRCQMVPFSRMVPRLRRIIRQISSELGKKVEFTVENAEGELDRTILERMVAPLEHMLRNAVDHGIEMPDVRSKSGKKEKGKIILALSREGGEVVLTLKDNGAGVNLEAVKNKAIERGLMAADSDLSDHEIYQFILHAGFSTAAKVTQISGRGVGMDVVHSEIKQMGGSLEIYSEQGQGSEFIVRLPFTVSVNRALMVTVGHDTYALPLNTIEGIVRVSPYELEAYYQPDAPMFEYAGQSYNLRYMGSLLNRGQAANLEGLTMPLPVILIRSNEYTVAVQVDRLLGSQEVVVKTLGPQFSMVDGLNGATVLGDGSVVIILDTLALIRADASRTIDDNHLLNHEADFNEREATRVMVVDDSVTVRKVTSRLLERYDLEVILAKDGLDAVTQLQEMTALPDVMLLDIEMPRMDGFEVVSRVRHNEKLEHIPICMITSRTGDKHRERAISLGANEYLGKPFQETELLQTISRLTGVEVLDI